MRMNAVPKLIVSRSLTDASAWANSRVIDGSLIDAVKREERDVIITGSLSVVRALMAEELVDEYRLLTFPTVLGTGQRLFPDDGPRADLECLSVERAGAAVLVQYRRTARGGSLPSPLRDADRPRGVRPTLPRGPIPLGRRLPGLRRYTVSRDVAAVRGEAAYYLVAELERDTIDDLRAAFASPEGRATAADATRLQELAPVRSTVFTVVDSVAQPNP